MIMYTPASAGFHQFAYWSNLGENFQKNRLDYPNDKLMD